MWADICSLADREEVEAFQIRTDMIRNVNHELMSRQFELRWFGQAAHGFLAFLLKAFAGNSRKLGLQVFIQQRFMGVGGKIMTGGTVVGERWGFNGGHFIFSASPMAPTSVIPASTSAT